MTNNTAAEIADLRDLIARSTEIIRKADRLKVRSIAQAERRTRRALQDRLDALLSA